MDMSCLLTMPLSGNAFYEMVEKVTIYKKTYLTMFTPNDHFLITIIVGKSIIVAAEEHKITKPWF